MVVGVSYFDRENIRNSEKFERYIQSGLTNAINETKKHKWKTQIRVVSRDYMDQIIQEQKEFIKEDLFTSDETVIELGNLIRANYIIVPSISNEEKPRFKNSKITNQYKIAFTLVDIESGANISDVDDTYREFKDDSIAKRNEKMEVQMLILMKELFNKSFPEENQMVLKRRCQAKTKKSNFTKQCSNIEPGFIINSNGYCKYHD